MRYVNKKTGYVFSTDCECAGGEWELVEEEKKSTKKDTKKEVKGDGK